MGNNKLPQCGTCEPMCQYAPKCAIPYAAEPSTEGMYVNFGNGGKYCKSIYYSNKYTTITNSLYNVSGTFGVNEGIPVAVWNDVTCCAYSQFPVPYYLQGQDGNTETCQVIYLVSVYDGNNPQTTTASPVLGLDSKTTVIGDTSDMFVKGVFPIFPVSASENDIDDTTTQYHIVTNGLIDISVKVGATKVSGQGDTMFTEVLEVNDVINVFCKVPLCFSTFRLRHLGTEVAEDTPVYMTFIKNACKEFSVGLLHGIAGTFTAGQNFPSDDAEVSFEWTSYKMVGAKGQGCPLGTPTNVADKLVKSFFNDIYAASSSLSTSTVATLSLLAAGVPISPGELTAAQQLQVVADSSASLVAMWRAGVVAFNAFILSLES